MISRAKSPTPSKRIISALGSVLRDRFYVVSIAIQEDGSWKQQSQVMGWTEDSERGSRQSHLIRQRRVHGEAWGGGAVL
jgi:hypothetical protein